MTVPRNSLTHPGRVLTVVRVDPSRVIPLKVAMVAELVPEAAIWHRTMPLGSVTLMTWVLEA